MKKLLFVLGILVLGNLQYSIIFKNNNISDFFFLNQQNNKLLEDIKKITIKNTIIGDNVVVQDGCKIGVKGFEPDPKDPNESISPVIEFDLDLIFS